MTSMRSVDRSRLARGWPSRQSPPSWRSRALLAPRHRLERRPEAARPLRVFTSQTTRSRAVTRDDVDLTATQRQLRSRIVKPLSER